MIDAFGNPGTATKYEAQIGAAMLKRERAAGHRPKLPQYVTGKEKCFIPRVYKKEWDAPVIACLSETTGIRLGIIMAKSGLKRSNVQSVLARLVFSGFVVVDITPHHQANLYRLNPRCGELAQPK